MEKSLINDISKTDLLTINQIIIRCAVKFQNVINKYSDAKKYSEKLSMHLWSSKTICYLFLFPHLLKLDDSQIYAPSELKKMIANDMQTGRTPIATEDITLNNLANEIISNKYITDSALSKTFQEFKRNGLLLNIKKKRQLKNFREQQTKKHKNIYKTRGRISFYTISPDTQEVRRLLSDPKAVEIINNSLKKSGLLYKYMEFLIKVFFYLMRRNSSEEETEILKKAVATSFTKFYPNLELDMKDWGLFKESLSSQDEKLLEKAAEEVVPILEEKFGFPYFIYGVI